MSIYLKHRFKDGVVVPTRSFACIAHLNQNPYYLSSRPFGQEYSSYKVEDVKYVTAYPKADFNLSKEELDIYLSILQTSKFKEAFKKGYTYRFNIHKDSLPKILFTLSLIRHIQENPYTAKNIIEAYRLIKDPTAAIIFGSSRSYIKTHTLFLQSNHNVLVTHAKNVKRVGDKYYNFILEHFDQLHKYPPYFICTRNYTDSLTQFIKEKNADTAP